MKKTNWLIDKFSESFTDPSSSTGIFSTSVPCELCNVRFPSFPAMANNWSKINYTKSLLQKAYNYLTYLHILSHHVVN
jgi:hypothetical protein